MKTAKKHEQHAITGFELTKIVLHNLKHFGLKPQTKTVLWVLIDCYNPENGSVVFPSIEYIATVGAMGLTSAKEGIKELINKGLIIKSKRGKIRGNYNKYLLTPKVQNPTSEQSENELLKQPESDRFMIRTNKERKNKKQTTIVEDVKPIKDVVISLKTFSSKKTVTLDDVPEIIKNNPKVDNPCAYWASLSDEVKAEKIKEQEEKEAQVKKCEERREQQILELKNKKIAEQKLREECNKPLSEQYTYETACAFLKNLAKVEKKLIYKGIAKDLTEIFNIEINKLLFS